MFHGKAKKTPTHTLIYDFTTSYCGRQEEPAILIYRLLLRMRRIYVASIRLDLTKNERNAQNAL